MPKVYDQDGDEVEVVLDAESCCSGWLNLSVDQTYLELDLDSTVLTPSVYEATVVLSDGELQSEYPIFLNILEMEPPVFVDWENHWEITMLENTTNVAYQIPYI